MFVRSGRLGVLGDCASRNSGPLSAARSSTAVEEPPSASYTSDAVPSLTRTAKHGAPRVSVLSHGICRFRDRSINLTFC
jgi:hypothetical protein